MNYKRKKIWLNTQKTKYCWVKLFADKKQMRLFYKNTCDQRGLPDHWAMGIEGVSMHYEQYDYSKSESLTPETGIVLLCFSQCGAGIVSHELLHAVLWAWKHKAQKKQYPIVINSMKQEEELLLNHTSAVKQFYRWYWKIVPLFQEVK